MLKFASPLSGIRSPFPRLRNSGGSFSPAALFAGGEQGAWYDPSDLTTLFQDSAGTTHVTTAGQPVGLMLDKSGRGNHRTQATAAARPTSLADGLSYDAVDDVISGSSAVLPISTSMSHFLVFYSPVPVPSWVLNASSANNLFAPAAGGGGGTSVGYTSSTFHKNSGASLPDANTVLAAFAGTDLNILEGRSLVRTVAAINIQVGGFPGYQFGGVIAEEIYCTTAMADLHRDEIMTYLADKWGVTL